MAFILSSWQAPAYLSMQSRGYQEGFCDLRMSKSIWWTSTQKVAVLVKLNYQLTPACDGHVLQDAPFFTVKLQVKLLPCLVLFCNGIAIDRVAGFDELGSKDDFPTVRLENRLLKAGVIVLPAKVEDSDEDNTWQHCQNVRSTNAEDEDSDFDWKLPSLRDQKRTILHQSPVLYRKTYQNFQFTGVLIGTNCRSFAIHIAEFSELLCKV